jgi:hypothetical protein
MSVIKAQNEYRHDNASGDALLADQYSRGEKDTSRDALLVRSKQRESNAASGHFLLEIFSYILLFGVLVVCLVVSSCLCFP